MTRNTDERPHDALEVAAIEQPVARGSLGDELIADSLPVSPSIRSLKGAVRWSGLPVSLKDMDEAVAQGAAARVGIHGPRDSAQGAER